MIAKGLLNSLQEKGTYVPIFINFSAQTSSIRTQEIIESKLEKKRKTVLGTISFLLLSCSFLICQVLPLVNMSPFLLMILTCLNLIDMVHNLLLSSLDNTKTLEDSTIERNSFGNK